MADKENSVKRPVIEISPNEFNYWESCRRRWAYKELERMEYQREKETRRKKR